MGPFAFSAKLTRREYRHEISEEECDQAKANGLLVVFGRADDGVELQGVIEDYVDAYDGTTFEVCSKGVKPTWRHCEEKTFDEAKLFFDLEKLPGFKIIAQWDQNGRAWTMRLEGNSLPEHYPFMIFEDGEEFCEGLVIDMNGLVSGT